MKHFYEPVDEDAAEVVGLIAYAALAAMTRLAKDGDQAPSIDAHIDNARMSANAFEVFKRLEVWSEHRDINLLERADEFSGLFDDVDQRTRPTTWWERAIKSYVSVGIFADVLREISQRHDLFEDTDTEWDLGQGSWVRTHLAPEIERDPQLSARLSLWARRVAGEALGLVRSTLFTHPELAKDPDTVDAIVAWVTKRHGERMKELNLQP